MALYHAVLERLARIIDEAAPIRIRNPCREQIRIECGLTDHGEYFTSAWIQRNDRSHVFAGIMFRI